VSVDAASAVCCCDAPVPTSCLSIWQCSMARFRLDYEIGLTTKIVGTTSNGLVTFSEVTNTMTGFATYQKTSTAPPLFGAVSTLYFRTGAAQFNFFYRRRIRSFYRNPNCQPCGSTYLASEQTITGSGGIAAGNNSNFWSYLEGRCSSCGCNYPNDPKHMTLLIGGYGSFTVNSTTYNEQGNSFPSTPQNLTRHLNPLLYLKDGCVQVNSFPTAAWETPPVLGWFGLPDPQLGFGQAFQPPYCSDINPPYKCQDPCDPDSVGPNYNASGCASSESEYGRVCQQGAGFVCEENGVVPTIQSYEKFGIFTASIV
jgi:hypothetical protein